ncbi:unnamed protein product [Vitrella brassicaformis CCMP3155]|uniref:Protein kinase domain-containing protein n=1 Tax=Vitrella brassicaformis (strain CCMP3155) TaxID=1169540 RepID=A0A0G4G9R8_VITBC|nr:unnamed protein product [Vitrella brassicaformis CCMP3155]|mmetsp:Transcript_30925/g.89937  ORF Transcript_30925/g.89937 Transcript_30925/m.89937 type:complete len:107 (-) Transcript_30925:1764-2084(-)|eukprot:CEM25682.1 unnamed protein product [Vitrella brassicaformis CCMP3155]
MGSLGFVERDVGLVDERTARGEEEAPPDVFQLKVPAPKTYGSFGDLLDDEQFRVVEEAGRGSNGFVFKVERTCSVVKDLFYAIKAIPRDSFDLETSMCTEEEFLLK